MDAQPPEPIPSHPEEIRATYDYRIGKSVTLQGTARITPAGIVTAGITVSAILLSLAVLAKARQPLRR